MSNIRVAVRVRPLTGKEKDDGSKEIVTVKGSSVIIENVKVLGIQEFGDSRAKLKEFTFDHCYDSMQSGAPYSTQAQVFEDLGTAVLKSAHDGFNACVFAYGQTGTGKTHTMMGYQNDPGLIPRICEGLFSHVSEDAGSHVSYRVDISYFEIYNEKVRDLLQPYPFHQNPKSLKVRNHPQGGPYVEGLSWHRVKNNEEIQTLIDKGNDYRVTAETYIHERSSRSHAIVTVCFTQATLEQNRPSEIVSKINLVDLAGSERADPTSKPDFRKRLTEGANINRSLVALGYIIKALAERSLLSWDSDEMGSMQSFNTSGGGESLSSNSPSGPNKQKLPFIPYRDSNLTWLLKDSLGGNAKTIMIATITPASQYYSETVSTLRYAQRAKNIINKPRINEDGNVALIRELRREIGKLQGMLADAKKGGNLLSLPDSEDSIIAEKLHENEEMAKQLTESWMCKWSSTHNIMKESDLSIRGLRNRTSSMGVMIDSQLPYLIGMDDDVLSTGVVIFHLKEGETFVGRDCAERPQDIVLMGPSILTEHCIIRNNNGDVTLYPNQGAICTVQGQECTEPTKLSQGDYVVLGGDQVFRFNNPTEAAKLREHRRSQGSLNTLSTSHLSFGGLSRASSYSSIGGDDPNCLSPYSQLGRSYPNYAAPDLCLELEKKHQSEHERIDLARQDLETLRQEVERADEQRQEREEQMYQQHEQHKQDLEDQKQHLARLIGENERAREKAEEELSHARESLAKEKEAFQEELNTERKRLQELLKLEKVQKLESFGIQTDSPNTATCTTSTGSDDEGHADGDEYPSKTKFQRRMSVEDQLKELEENEFSRRMSYRETEQSLSIQEEDIEDQYLHTQDQIQSKIKKIKAIEEEYKELDKTHLKEVTSQAEKLKELQKKEAQLEVYIQEKEELINVSTGVPTHLRSATSELCLAGQILEFPEDYEHKTASLQNIQSGLNEEPDKQPFSPRALQRSASAESLDTEVLEMGEKSNMADKQSNKTKKDLKISSTARSVTSRLYKPPEPKFKYVPKGKEKEVKPVARTRVTRDRDVEPHARSSPSRVIRDANKGHSPSPQSHKHQSPSPARDVGGKNSRTSNKGTNQKQDSDKRTKSPSKPSKNDTHKIDNIPGRNVSSPSNRKAPERGSNLSAVSGRLGASGKVKQMASASNLASVPESISEGNDDSGDQVTSKPVVKRRTRRGRRDWDDDEFRTQSAPDSQAMAAALDKYTETMNAQQPAGITSVESVVPTYNTSLSVDESQLGMTYSQEGPAETLSCEMETESGIDMTSDNKSDINDPVDTVVDNDNVMIEGGLDDSQDNIKMVESGFPGFPLDEDVPDSEKVALGKREHIPDSEDDASDRDQDIVPSKRLKSHEDNDKDNLNKDLSCSDDSLDLSSDSLEQESNNKRLTQSLPAYLLEDGKPNCEEFLNDSLEDPANDNTLPQQDGVSQNTTNELISGNQCQSVNDDITKDFTPEIKTLEIISKTLDDGFIGGTNDSQPSNVKQKSIHLAFSGVVCNDNSDSIGNEKSVSDQVCETDVQTDDNINPTGSEVEIKVCETLNLTFSGVVCNDNSDSIGNEKSVSADRACEADIQTDDNINPTGSEIEMKACQTVNLTFSGVVCHDNSDSIGNEKSVSDQVCEADVQTDDNINPTGSEVEMKVCQTVNLTFSGVVCHDNSDSLGNEKSVSDQVCEADVQTDDNINPTGSELEMKAKEDRDQSVSDLSVTEPVDTSCGDKSDVNDSKHDVNEKGQNENLADVSNSEYQSEMKNSLSNKPEAKNMGVNESNSCVNENESQIGVDRDIPPSRDSIDTKSNNSIPIYESIKFSDLSENASKLAEDDKFSDRKDVVSDSVGHSLNIEPKQDLTKHLLDNNDVLDVSESKTVEGEATHENVDESKLVTDDNVQTSSVTESEPEMCETGLNSDTKMYVEDVILGAQDKVVDTGIDAEQTTIEKYVEDVIVEAQNKYLEKAENQEQNDQIKTENQEQNGDIENAINHGQIVDTEKTDQLENSNQNEQVDMIVQTDIKADLSEIDSENQTGASTSGISKEESKEVSGPCNVDVMIEQPNSDEQTGNMTDETVEVDESLACQDSLSLSQGKGNNDDKIQGDIKDKVREDNKAFDITTESRVVDNSTNDGPDPVGYKNETDDNTGNIGVCDHPIDGAPEAPSNVCDHPMDGIHEASADICHHPMSGANDEGASPQSHDTKPGTCIDTNNNVMPETTPEVMEQAEVTTELAEEPELEQIANTVVDEETRTIGICTSPELLDALEADNNSNESDIDPNEELQVLQDALDQLPAKPAPSGPQLSTARRAARQRAMIRQKLRAGDSEGVGQLSDESTRSGTPNRTSSRPDSGSRRRKRPTSNRNSRLNTDHTSDDYDSSENDSLYSDDSIDNVRHAAGQNGYIPNTQLLSSNGDVLGTEVGVNGVQTEEEMLSRHLRKRHARNPPRHGQESLESAEVESVDGSSRSVGVQTFNRHSRGFSSSSVRTDVSDIENSFASGEFGGMAMSPVSLWNSNDRQDRERHSSSSSGIIRTLSDLEKSMSQTQRSGPRSNTSFVSQGSNLDRGPTEVWSSSTSDLRPVPNFREELSYVMETEMISPGASSLDYTDDVQSQQPSFCVRPSQEEEQSEDRPDCSTPRSGRNVNISFPESQIQQVSNIDTNTPVTFEVTIHEDNTNILYNVEKTEYRTYALRNPETNKEPGIIPDSIHVNINENVSSTSQEKFESHKTESVHLQNENNSQDDQDSIVVERSFRASYSAGHEMEVDKGKNKTRQVASKSEEMEETQNYILPSHVREQMVEKKKTVQLKPSGVVEATNYHDPLGEDEIDSKVAEDQLDDSECTSDYGTFISIDGRKGCVSFTSDSEDDSLLGASARTVSPHLLLVPGTSASSFGNPLATAEEQTVDMPQDDTSSLPAEVHSICSTQDVESPTIALVAKTEMSVASEPITQLYELRHGDVDQDDYFEQSEEILDDLRPLNTSSSSEEGANKDTPDKEDDAENSDKDGIEDKTDDGEKDGEDKPDITKEDDKDEEDMETDTSSVSTVRPSGVATSQETLIDEEKNDTESTEKLQQVEQVSVDYSQQEILPVQEMEAAQINFVNNAIPNSSPRKRDHTSSCSSNEDSFQSLDQAETSSCSSDYRTPQQSPIDFHDNEEIPEQVEYVVIPDTVSQDKALATTPRFDSTDSFHRTGPVNTSSPKRPANVRTVSVNTDSSSTPTTPVAPTVAKVSQMFGSGNDPGRIEAVRKEIENKIAKIQHQHRSLSDSAISSDFTDGDSASLSPRSNKHYDFDKLVAFEKKSKSQSEQGATSQLPIRLNAAIDFDSPAVSKYPFNDSGNVYDQEQETGVCPEEMKSVPNHNDNEPKQRTTESIHDRQEVLPVKDIETFPENIIDTALAIKPFPIKRSFSVDSIATLVNTGTNKSRAVRESKSTENKEHSEGMVENRDTDKCDSLPSNHQQPSSVDVESPLTMYTKSTSFSNIPEDRQKEYRRSLSEGNIDDFDNIQDSSADSNDSITFVFMGKDFNNIEGEFDDEVQRNNGEGYDPCGSGRVSDSDSQSDDIKVEEQVVKDDTDSVNISARGHPSPGSSVNMDSVMSRSLSTGSGNRECDNGEEDSSHSASEEIEEIIIRGNQMGQYLDPQYSPTGSPFSSTDNTQIHQTRYHDDDTSPLRHKFGIDEKILPISERSVSADNIPKQLTGYKDIQRSRSTGMLDVGMEPDPESESDIFPPAPISYDDDRTDQSFSLRTMSDSGLDQISQRTVSEIGASLSNRSSSGLETSSSNSLSSAVVRSVCSVPSSSDEESYEEIVINYSNSKDRNKRKRIKQGPSSGSSEGEIDIETLEDRQAHIKHVLDTVEKFILPRPQLVDRGVSTETENGPVSVSIGMQTSLEDIRETASDNSILMENIPVSVLPALAARFRSQSMDSFGLGTGAERLQLSEGAMSWVQMSELMVETTHLLRSINDRLPEMERNASISSTEESEAILKQWEEISIQTGRSLTNLQNVGLQTDDLEENVQDMKDGVEPRQEKMTETVSESTQVDAKFRMKPLDTGDIVIYDILPDTEAIICQMPVQTDSEDSDDAYVDQEEMVIPTKGTSVHQPNVDTISPQSKMTKNTNLNTTIDKEVPDSEPDKETSVAKSNTESQIDAHRSSDGKFVAQMKSELGFDDKQDDKNTVEQPSQNTPQKEKPVLPGFTMPNTKEIEELRKEHAKLMDNLRKASELRQNRKETIRSRKQAPGEPTITPNANESEEREEYIEVSEVGPGVFVSKDGKGAVLPESKDAYVSDDVSKFTKPTYTNLEDSPVYENVEITQVGPGRYVTLDGTDAVLPVKNNQNQLDEDTGVPTNDLSQYLDEEITETGPGQYFSADQTAAVLPVMKNKDQPGKGRDIQTDDLSKSGDENIIDNGPGMFYNGYPTDVLPVSETKDDADNKLSETRPNNDYSTDNNKTPAEVVDGSNLDSNENDNNIDNDESKAENDETDTIVDENENQDNLHVHVEITEVGPGVFVNQTEDWVVGPGSFVPSKNGPSDMTEAEPSAFIPSNKTKKGNYSRTPSDSQDLVEINIQVDPNNGLQVENKQYSKPKPVNAKDSPKQEKQDNNHGKRNEHIWKLKDGEIMAITDERPVSGSSSSRMRSESDASVSSNDTTMSSEVARVMAGTNVDPNELNERSGAFIPVFVGDDLIDDVLSDGNMTPRNTDSCNKPHSSDADITQDEDAIIPVLHSRAETIPKQDPLMHSSPVNKDDSDVESFPRRKDLYENSIKCETSPKFPSKNLQERPPSGFGSPDLFNNEDNKSQQFEDVDSKSDTSMETVNESFTEIVETKPEHIPNFTGIKPKEEPHNKVKPVKAKDSSKDNAPRDDEDGKSDTSMETVNESFTEIIIIKPKHAPVSEHISPVLNLENEISPELNLDNESLPSKSNATENRKNLPKDDDIDGKSDTSMETVDESFTEIIYTKPKHIPDVRNIQPGEPKAKADKPVPVIAKNYCNAQTEPALTKSPPKFGKSDDATQVSMEFSDDFTQTDDGIISDITPENAAHLNSLPSGVSKILPSSGISKLQDKPRLTEGQQPRNGTSEKLKDDLEKLQEERQHILDLLGLSYLPTSLTVELLEAKLNYCIGQTDLLLENVEDEFTSSDSTKLYTRDQQRTVDYISKYRADLKKSKRDIQECREKLSTRKGPGMGRGRTNIRKRDVFNEQRQAFIDAFKLERLREQHDYEGSRHGTPVRGNTPLKGNTPVRGNTPLKGNTPLRGNTPLMGNSPVATPRSERSRSSSPTYIPGYMTPREHRDHLVDLRRQLIRDIAEEEYHHRSVSPVDMLNTSPPLHHRYRSPPDHHLGYSPEVAVSVMDRHERSQPYYNTYIVAPGTNNVTAVPRSVSLDGIRPHSYHTSISPPRHAGSYGRHLSPPYSSLDARMTAENIYSPQESAQIVREIEEIKKRSPNMSAPLEEMLRRSSFSSSGSHRSSSSRPEISLSPRTQSDPRLARPRHTSPDTHRYDTPLSLNLDSLDDTQGPYSPYSAYAREHIIPNERSSGGILRGSYQLYDDRSDTSSNLSFGSDTHSDSGHYHRLDEESVKRLRPVQSTDIKARIGRHKR